MPTPRAKNRASLVGALALAGLFLLMAGRASVAELMLAALAALLAVRSAGAVQRLAEVRVAAPARWAPALAKALFRLPGDIVALARVALRRGRHRGAARPRFALFGAALGGDAPADVTRRALVLLFGSLSPRSIAVVIGPGRDEILVHEAPPERRPPAREPEWPI